MAALAKFETAPTGTQYRISGEAEWQDANEGDELYVNYQTRNTESNDYQVRLYQNAQIRFDTVVSITLNNITGTVKYEDANEDWITAGSSGQYNGKAVYTNAESSVIVIVDARGGFRPPPQK